MALEAADVTWIVETLLKAHLQPFFSEKTLDISNQETIATALGRVAKQVGYPSTGIDLPYADRTLHEKVDVLLIGFGELADAIDDIQGTLRVLQDRVDDPNRGRASD
jgi:hypothetical protein